MIDSSNLGSDFLDRVKSALGVTTDYELAKALGRATSSVHNWRRRGNIPLDECINVSNKTNVSLDWLILGKGNGYVIQSRLMPPPTGDLHIIEYNGPNEDHSRIPIYDIEAAAGTGWLFDDELVEASIFLDTGQLERDGLDPSQVVGVRVRGDSMGETLHDGDRVLVDRSSRTPDGVFLLRMDDGLRIKRVQRVAGGGWMLISDNARYQPELVDPLSNQNVEIIGECVMRLGRIS